MSAKLSLLQQARIEKKKLEFSKSLKIDTSLSFSEQIKLLLPNYDQQIKPKKFHNSIQLEKGLKGGVGSGKTKTLAAESIFLSWMNKPYPHLHVSPSFDNALDVFVPHLEQLCQENGIEYDFIPSRNKFLLIFGKTKSDIANILIYGGDKPKFIKGITAASGSLDEPFSQKEETNFIWLERIRHTKAKRLCRCWAGTAEPDKMQWGHEYFDSDTIDKEELFAITISTYDNKYLGRNYIKILESKYDTKMREVYMLGKNVNLSSGKAYYSFDNIRNKRSAIEIPDLYKQPIIQIVLGFDFNVDPMVASEWIINDQVRHQIDEYKIHSSNTAELCSIVINRFLNKYPGINSDQKQKYSLIVTGDSSGRKRSTLGINNMTDILTIKECFEKSGLVFTMYFPEKNPFVHDRVSYTNKLFEMELAVIHDNCVNSIRDRELVTWKTGSDNFVLDKSKKDLTHLSDAGDYALWVTKKIISENNDENESLITKGGQRRFRNKR